jgi:hypothetical protein
MGNYEVFMDGVQKYECEVCDFWYVLHGNPTNIKYEEKLKNCQNCNKVKRIEAYKDFWQKRSEK